MEIDLKLIRHIGKLSRIELTDEEVHTFKDQFQGILAYFDKLNELDTGSIEPLTQPVAISNVLKDDEPGVSLSTQEALQNAPDSDGSYFKVPKVLGDSQ